LVRKNFATWLSLLAISSVINWDAFIVKYNLAHKPIEQVDFRYILNLSDAVLPELIKIRNKKDYIAFNTKSLASPEHLNFNARLSHKINDYVKTYKTTWQSWDLRDQEITHLIVSN
jgi:23S rRNA maturation-related 3'-5' exoribonuclease YhaM